MKLSSSANDNLIDRTVALWQRRLGRDLTRENAREIVENVAGFFNTLAKWQAEISRSANDNVRPAVHAAEIETCSAQAVRPGGQGIALSDPIARRGLCADGMVDRPLPGSFKPAGCERLK